MMDAPASGRLAYLASRHPVISHTFVDNEILALEAAGWPLAVASLNPPKDEFIHPRLHGLRAPRLYPPPPAVLAHLETRARRNGHWPEALVTGHESRWPETNPARRARNALWLADAFQRLDVAHVHLHFANAATHTALFLSEIAGIGYSFTPQARDFLVETPAALLDELCARARFVVAPCHFAAAALIERAPKAAARLIEIPNGIDPAPYPAAAPNSAGVRRILSVGRMVEIKGFPDLIEAFARVHSDHPELQLRLMGDGPLRAPLQERAAGLGLGETIVFLGQQPIEVMREEMARADLFALAARPDTAGGSDMLPTVITEAMFCGLPVLATRLAGIPEQVVDGETGLLVAPGEVDSLAAALARLVAEPGLAARCGKAGKQRAHKYFDQTATLPQLAAAFRDHWPETTEATETTRTVRTAPTTAPTNGASPARDAGLCEVTFYDLSQPNRVDWLEAEGPLWRERGAALVVAGTPSEADFARLATLLPDLTWLPDGMVLEQDWQAAPAHRAMAARWRMDLSSAVDGERLLTAARRATWFARNWPNPDFAFFAPGSEEAFVLALASDMRGGSEAEAGEAGDRPAGGLLTCLDTAAGFNGKLLRHLAARSTRCEDTTGRTDGPLSNHLLHGTPSPRYRRLGPLTRRVREEPPSATERRQALESWLEESGASNGARREGT